MHDTRDLNIVTLGVAERIAADADQTGVDISGLIGTIAINQTAKNVAGTDPTLDTVLEDSADNITFAAITGGAFTQVTDAGTKAAVDETLYLDSRALKKYIRVADDIGGTDTPSFDRAVTLIGQQLVGGA